MEKVKHTKETTYEITLRMTQEEFLALRRLTAQATAPGFQNAPIVLDPVELEIFKVWQELYDILNRRI